MTYKSDLIANRENICILSTFSFNLREFIATVLPSELLCRVVVADQLDTIGRDSLAILLYLSRVFVSTTLPLRAILQFPKGRQRNRSSRGQTQEMRMREVDANKRNINPWQLIIVF